MAVDLRKKVEEDRGLLKKIELAIPGFRGYRKREDLRIADSLLRAQLADRLKHVGMQLEQCRQDLVKRMELEVLEDAARLVNNIQKTENRVRHAEQGYSGISADFRIEVEELNRLYEWDLQLLSDIDKIRAEVAGLERAILGGSRSELPLRLRAVNDVLQDFNMTFDKRIEIIGGIGV
ncbi:MAG: hypothetical protein QME47_06725 [Candidatus Thermoplasmatota archaeon]|nr:hypothetical protein [Candidatus Thermoplasmatota archaeon]